MIPLRLLKEGDCRVLQSRKDSFLYFNIVIARRDVSRRKLRKDCIIFFSQAGMLDLQLNYTL